MAKGSSNNPVTIADITATLLQTKQREWTVIAQSWAGRELPEPTILVTDDYGNHFKITVEKVDDIDEEKFRYDPVKKRAHNVKRPHRSTRRKVREHDGRTVRE